MIIPFFVPIKIETEIVDIQLEKTVFLDTDGYKKIMWGNDENSLVTFENPQEWSQLVLDNLTPPQA